ncbi:putative polysaccharide biosynthesis protein [Bacillus suaedaesalsae]|uniref:Polysaccharide biosynthesis protein n=1 Tax=Bacillus suaedaesalsae TaxID=2810349 RepID=A0ABS2DKN7_9BACI|nr:polysaccharide biosynthesis protein [Bacillus suaedaesalsae]MBM6619072.1 polysaccharide biosynthesis protein [Bacillus suaedaesalsae]
MSKRLLKGTLILTVATLISKIVGSAFRIPLQNLAGDEVLGIFTLVYPLYMVALILSVAGIPIAISKLISDALAKNENQKVHDIFKSASILSVLFGVTSFLFILLFSNILAEVLGGQNTRLSIIIVSITLLIAPYMAVYRGYFQGYGDMQPTAISQVLEQLTRVFLILIIAYFTVRQGFAAEHVSGGIMIGSSIGAMISLFYLRHLFTKRTSIPKVSHYEKRTFLQTSKQILIISVPIAIGSISMALLNLADSISVPLALKSWNIHQGQVTHLFGIYGRGLSLVQIATVFSSSIIIPLIPLIGMSIASNDLQSSKNAIERSYTLTHLISWPIAFGLLSLSVPINLALFLDLQGSDVLAVVCFSSVFTSLAVLSTGVLQGLGKAKHAAYIILIAFVCKIILNIFLVNYIGIMGAALSTLFVYILITFVNSYFIKKEINLQLYHKRIYIFIVSSILTGLLIGVPTSFIDFKDWSRFLSLSYITISSIAGLIVYVGLLLLLKGINGNELKEAIGRKSLFRKRGF